MKGLLNILIISILLFSCQSKKVDYSEWKKENLLKSKSTKADTAIFYSSALLIDTIYRSMQGPYVSERIQIEKNNEEIVYIIGYSSQVVDAKSNQALPPRYMCHNNLNYAEVEDLPWNLKTSGSNSRIFTLSEGQTQLNLPNGFGIPIKANQPFEMVSQVLNHNEENLHLKSRHKVEIIYKGETEGESITPLYQQSVFVTQQLEGPEGAYGLPLSCSNHVYSKNDVSKKATIHDCSIVYEKGEYNPYSDKYGIKYTGHWTLPNGKQELKTDVTRMLDLSEDSRIHMIGVHLHPFAEKLSFWDTTSDSLLYETNIQKDSSNFSFDNIAFFQSTQGIPVYVDHRYELRSTYHCTDSSTEHTAMAVMYLYLED